MNHDTTEAEFLFHQACTLCGSSDACAVYDDGHTHCFSCNQTIQGDTVTVKERKEVGFDPLDFEVQDLPKRGIYKDACQKYKYGVGMFRFKGMPAAVRVQVANYYDLEGNLEGQKIRDKDKQFAVLGKVKALYGMQLFPSKGKRVVVCEGEIDTLSMATAQNLKWPVVGIPTGAAGAAKAFKRNMEWLCGYDEVIIMFDDDEPGLRAAQECAELLPPGKVKIARLPLHDANDMLVAGKQAEMVSCMFNARPYRPDGIVGFEEAWEQLIKVDASHSLNYPWEALNGVTRGCRTGELVMITAGTGIGKSTICKEIAYALSRQEPGIGYVALEENVKKSVQGLLSLHLDRPLHLLDDTEQPSEVDLRAAFEAVVEKGQVYFYQHFGSMASDNLLSKLRYLIVGLGCHTIVLDHISIVISGQTGENERRSIDQLMTALRSLTEETGVRMIVVSHLKRTEGTSWEQGKEPRLADLRGSAALEQMSDIVIGASRDQKDEVNRERIKLHVLKNRHSGQLGDAGYLKYNIKTGRLVEVGHFEDVQETGDGSEKDGF